MTGSELKRKYVEFFLTKGHAHISGASLIPENDPKFREAMEKAYADTVAGNIPPVTPRKINFDDTLVVS